MDRVYQKRCELKGQLLSLHSQLVAAQEENRMLRSQVLASAAANGKALSPPRGDRNAEAAVAVAAVVAPIPASAAAAEVAEPLLVSDLRQKLREYQVRDGRSEIRDSSIL